MIPRARIAEILAGYDKDDLTIGVLGGHSGLDVCRGAKKLGFRTLAVCERGRERTYAHYYRTRGAAEEGDGAPKGIVDEIVLVDKFRDIAREDIQELLRARNTVFIHNRYFWVYCDFAQIEDSFEVPIFGTRGMVRLEERDVAKNQYWLMERAGIRFPRIFASAGDIDRLAIVKVNEAARGYERAFFLAQSPADFERKAGELVAQGTITREALAKAVIEEYVVGAQVNFNYFWSPIEGELELMGTDMRRQTNLDGLMRIPADEQLEVLRHVRPKMIETGHIACTTKESTIEKAFELGERFVATARKECAPGIIGPFALQGAIVAEDGKEDIVVFDVSMRIPGSPLTMFTPHSGYLYGESMSFGERIAREIRKAARLGRLHELCT